jgi:hypothetical protein
MSLVLRDGRDVEALVTDRYLEALLSAGDRGAVDTPSAAELDPLVRAAALRLAVDLTRVHPSFRFEERLAGRLADVAARMSLARVAGETAGAVPPPGTEDRPSRTLARVDPLDLLDPARPEATAGQDRRPLIIGGTIASAAISIAGAAIVAWRLSRPGGHPAARAIRGAHDRVDRVRLA